MDNKESDSENKKKAKELVRSIIIEDFKQKADDAAVEAIATKMLKALPGRDHH